MAAWLWHRLRRAFAPVATPLFLTLVLFAGARSSTAAERIKVAATATTDPVTSPALSGTIVRAANATTSWYLYAGACADREAGTWAPRLTATWHPAAPVLHQPFQLTILRVSSGWTPCKIRRAAVGSRRAGPSRVWRNWQTRQT